MIPPSGPPRPVVLVAARLRAERVTRKDAAGHVRHRLRPWSEVRDELARLGFGLYDPQVLATAVELVGDAADNKPRVLTDDELLALNEGWRRGWLEQFPGEPYPGLVEARRRIRAKLFTGGRA